MYLAFKRLFDILVALVLLILLAPLFLVLMLLLSVTGEHKVFYLQERVGYKNCRFKIWKFATMLQNSPSIGTGDITIRNDPRLIPMGRFLRKTKLNELPQLINVLIGDMTLVGPRPLMYKGFERYSPKVQALIYNVKPGITGVGSVVFRDEEKMVTASKDYETAYQAINNHKGNLEIWYQQHIGFYTDFMLMFLTVWVLLSPESKLMHKVFPDLPQANFNPVLNTEPSAKAS